MKILCVALITIGLLVSLSACIPSAFSSLEYEYTVDIISSTADSRYTDLDELQSVLDERGLDGWQLVTLDHATYVGTDNIGTIAIFQRIITDD